MPAFSGAAGSHLASLSLFGFGLNPACGVGTAYLGKGALRWRTMWSPNRACGFTSAAAGSANTRAPRRAAKRVRDIGGKTPEGTRKRWDSYRTGNAPPDQQPRL